MKEQESEEIPFPGLLSGLWGHLNRRRQWQTLAVTILMFFSAFAEVITLGAVVPFIAVLVEPERALAFGPVPQVAEWFGITSGEELVFPLAGAFLVAALGAASLRFMVLWTTTRLAMATGAELATKAFEQTLYQPYDVHVRRHSSEVTSGVIQKVETIVHGMLVPLQQAAGSVLTLVSVTVALLLIDAQIALAAVVVIGGGYFLISRAVSGSLLRNGRHVAKTQVQVLKVIQESIGGIRDVLINGTQALFVDQFRRSDGQRRRSQASTEVLQQSPRLFMEAIVMILLVSLVMIIRGRDGGVVSNLPELAAFAVAGQRMLPISQQLYATVSTMKTFQPLLSGALKILDEPISEVERFERGDAFSFASSLECTELSFRYDKDEPWVLDKINLNIPKGSRVGLVGETGSGKSTLLDLMMGLLEPTSGTLTIDGVLLEGEVVRAWRSSIAHVSQDIFLLDSSFAENIAFGVPEDLIDYQLVRESARRAQIDSFIISEPDGYETIVGERGVRLSGGERQRVGVARALYRGAPVLILDEATSGLDSVTERLVLSEVTVSAAGTTVIMVAHRLSTLRDCDQIFEVKDGRIAASGRFEDLIKSSDSFREMARSWVDKE
ncbi:MAG: ABC transporter ATP-binding protein [Acidimicrobiales bacterium]|nr:ABC transporter ATP-binding protein [Acidimicrobiales bacterium]